MIVLGHSFANGVVTVEAVGCECALPDRAG